MRHIFLTGEKQVGKSTIWQKVLESRPHTGFITLPFCVNGEKKGYILHSLLELPEGENDCPCVVRIGAKKHAAVLPVFEGAGVHALEQALRSETPLILMDEIGKAEKEAAGFMQAVLACLDDERHQVVGVLQKGHAPLQEAIRQREDVLVLEVTQENREQVQDRVEALMEKRQK